MGDVSVEVTVGSTTLSDSANGLSFFFLMDLAGDFPRVFGSGAAGDGFLGECLPAELERRAPEKRDPEDSCLLGM